MNNANQAKKSVREFILFVDTNVIWTGDENIGRLELLPVQFRQQWLRISDPGDVSLVIPDVVLFELAYQKQRQILRAHKEARSNLKKIEAALELGIPDVPEKDWGEVGHAVQAQLRNQVKEIPHCKSVAIPYDTIVRNIKGIVDSAIWRRAPFKDGGSEAGFRDSILLETIRHFQADLIHSELAFITKDARLREAIRREFSSAKNFGLYSNLDEFERFLELARIRYQPEFLHSVTSRASESFEKSIWIEAEIAKQLVERYGLVVGHFEVEKSQASPLESIRPGLLGLGGTARECVGDPLPYFGNTKLLAVVGESEFHWETSVLFIAPYAPIASLLASSGNQGDAVFRVLVIEIEWKAMVNDCAEFTNAGLLRDRLMFESYTPSIEYAKSLRTVLDML